MKEAWMKVLFLTLDNLFALLEGLWVQPTLWQVLGTYTAITFCRFFVDCVKRSSLASTGFEIDSDECHFKCWIVFKLFWRGSYDTYSSKFFFFFNLHRFGMSLPCVLSFYYHTMFIDTITLTLYWLGVLWDFISLLYCYFTHCCNYYTIVGAFSWFRYIYLWIRLSWLS